MNNYFYILTSIIILFIASYLNEFPAGHIFASGDISQLYTFDSLHAEGMSLWSYSNGLGKFNQEYPYYPYYYLISQLSLVFPSLRSLSIIYMFVFSLLSYLGFRYSLSLLYKENNMMKEFLSLAYVFNVVVLYFYVYTWSYTAFAFIYTVWPIIITSLIIILKEKNNSNILLKSIPFYIISGISFGNFAWFAVILFTTGVLCVLWGIVFIRSFSELIRTIKSYIVFLFVYILSTLWATYPAIWEMIEIANVIYSGGWSFNIGSWITGQAISTHNMLFLHPGPFFDSMPFGIHHLSLSLLIIPIVLIILNNDKSKDRAYAVMLISLFVIISIMGTKLKGIISTDLMIYIFSNPLFVAFKSSDKAIALLPTILLLSIALLLRRNRHRILISFIVLSLSIISSYPLLIGGVKTKYDLLIPYGEDYKTVERSMLREVPSDYAKVASIVNADTSTGKVLSLPYSVNTSFGWVEYPKWSHIGVDPTSQLFNRGVIQPNQNGYFGLDNYGLFFNNNTSPDLLESLLKLLDVRYVTYHHDVAMAHKNSVKETLNTLLELGSLAIRYSGENIVLYEYLKSNLSINLPQKEVLVNKMPSMLQSLNDYSEDTVYMLIEDFNNPVLKKYLKSARQENATCRRLVNFEDNRDAKVAILHTCDGFLNVVLSDRYLNQAKIDKVIEINNGEEKDVTNSVDTLHYQANWWMNGWIVDANKNKTYKIYFNYSFPVFYFLLAPIFIMIFLARRVVIPPKNQTI